MPHMQRPRSAVLIHQQHCWCTAGILSLRRRLCHTGREIVVDRRSGA
jgi:hypothetical protein